MSEKELLISPSKTEKEITEIYNFNVKAFAEMEDFSWSLENLKKEVKNGWNIYSVTFDGDIVCALFLKHQDNSLLTKNTPIKMNFQGNGFSHIIKDFYEEYAKDNDMSTVYNYCPVDNFRMISLNEGHDYIKTGEKLEGTNLEEWIKSLK